MIDLPLIRTRYCRRFSRALERLGENVDPSLEHARLDRRTVGVEDGFMPVPQLYDFLEHVVTRTGHYHLGLEAGISPRKRHSEFSREVAVAPTLTRSLETVIINAKSEDATANFSLERRGASILLCCGRLAGPPEAIRQIELYRYAALLEVIRYAAGPNWLPSSITFQQTDSRNVAAAPLLGGVDIQFGTDRLAITIPDQMLDHSLQSDKKIRRLNRRGAAGVPAAPISYESAIKELIRTNLCAGRHKIQDLAETLDVSVRSLQRKLFEHGLRFNELLEQSRVETAQSMLAMECRLSDIAAALGYQHSTHFSRAFKRVCGETPRQFRYTQLQNTE